MRYIYAVVLLLIISSFVFSQEEIKVERTEREITVCKIELNKIGKATDATYNFKYLLKTVENGQVKEAKHTNKNTLSYFVNQEKISDCFKTWKLKPSSEYEVLIKTGFRSDEHFMLIFNEEEKIKYFYNTNIFEFSTFKNNNNSTTEISICSPKLTEAGRQSAFRFGYRYIIQSDENGAVKEMLYINPKSNYESLSDSSNVISCLKKWKLLPSTKYRIYISFGTSGGPDSLNISSKNENIRIIL